MGMCVFHCGSLHHVHTHTHTRSVMILRQNGPRVHFLPPSCCWGRPGSLTNVRRLFPRPWIIHRHAAALPERHLGAREWFCTAWHCVECCWITLSDLPNSAFRLSNVTPPHCFLLPSVSPLHLLSFLISCEDIRLIGRLTRVRHVPQTPGSTFYK